MVAIFMGAQKEFWKNWWDEQARHSTSDYALNRRTTVHLDSLEEKTSRQFLFMGAQKEFWKNWWDEQARHSTSDYALNRRTTVHLDSLEEKTSRQFLEAVNPQSSDMVLDAGCGSGRNISILSPRVKAIIGVDYSAQMLARAGERIAAENLNNASLLQGDVTRLEFPSRTFDKVVCASVLQYIDDQDCQRALVEMVRVCKSGGRLVIHLKNGASLYGISLKVLRLISKVIGRKMKPEYYRSRLWHEKKLALEGAIPLDYDGFGIFTFVPLPSWVVGRVLEWELRLKLPKALKKLAVNYQLTLLVEAICCK